MQKSMPNQKLKTAPHVFRSCALGLVALTLSVASVRAADPTAVGLWQKTEDNKPVVWVLIVDHGGTFEGAIAKTFPAPGEPSNETCAKCVDDRKDEPVLGITFIRGMKQAGLKYEHGNILDPRDGKIYKAKMSVSADGKDLTVRGYWGVALLGKDETWQKLPDTFMTTLDPTVVEKYLPVQAAALKMHPQPAPTKKPVTSNVNGQAVKPGATVPAAPTGKRGPAPSNLAPSNLAPSNLAPAK